MNPANAIGTLVVGYGYWGPNIVRNVVERPGVPADGTLRARREPDQRLPPPPPRRLDRARPRRRAGRPAGSRRSRSRPRPTPTTRSSAAPSKPASTCWSRSRWRGAAEEAAELVALAEERDRVLMPGHTFLYSPSVNKVRDLIQDDELGEIYFVTSSRMNLGLYQRDGVVLDLAPHDLSILLHWLGKPLVEVERQRPQRLPGGRPRDRLPDPALRGRRPGQRAALLAGAAQDAPDGRRRQPAHGPVRGHRRRRLGADLRPRPRLRRAARQLRRVPPDLPHGRHGRPADCRPLEPLGLRSSATSPRRSARARRRSPTPASGSRSCSGWKRSSSRCTPRGNRFRLPRWTACSAAPAAKSRPSRPRHRHRSERRSRIEREVFCRLGRRAAWRRQAVKLGQVDQDRVGRQLVHGCALSARLAPQELPAALVEGEVDLSRRLR